MEKVEQINAWLEAERQNIGQKLTAVDYRQVDDESYLRYTFDNGSYIEWNLAMQREVHIAPQVTTHAEA